MSTPGIRRQPLRSTTPAGAKPRQGHATSALHVTGNGSDFTLAISAAEQALFNALFGPIIDGILAKSDI